MRHRSFIAATLTALFMASPAAAEECKPSQWGPDDELGSANLVTPERTMAAMKMVKQGKSLPLGITIDRNTPAYPPRSLTTQVVQPNQQGGLRKVLGIWVRKASTTTAMTRRTLQPLPASRNLARTTFPR